MKSKILVYIGAVVVLLLLALSFFGGGGGMHGNTAKNIDKQSVDSNIVGNMDHMNNQPFSSGVEDLAKYRANSIPEECRLPKNRDDIGSWKEHLSHHEDTYYCLDYFN